MFDILPLIPHIFADPDPGSQNLADPADPDPKHCKQTNRLRKRDCVPVRTPQT